MTTFLQKLQSRNLPITSAHDVTGDFVRTREFTEEEVALLNDAIEEHFNPSAYVKKVNRQLVIDNIDTFIISSGLVNRHLSTINSNSDRDKLLQVICFKLHITDSSATIRISTDIYSTEANVVLLRQFDKKNKILSK